MRAIWYKNICHYRRNLSELITQIINSLIQVLPIYFMLYSHNSNSKDNFFVIFSYLIACLILDLCIGVCFEYYKEILQDSNIDFTLSGLTNFKFAMAQALYYLVLNIWIIIVDIVILFLMRPFKYAFRLSVANAILFLGFNLLFIISLCGIASFCAYLIDKTKVFSIGSLICNCMLIFSGCYTPIVYFPQKYYILFYINPFFYYVNGMQYVVLGVPLPMCIERFLLFNLMSTGIIVVAVKNVKKEG